MMHPRRLLLLGLLAGAGLAQAQTWDFEVKLDGKPIGTHRFVVSGPAAAREVKSTAQFDVKVLGIPFYRYRHQAQEHWQGDCIKALASQTDDDGKPVQVDQQHDATPGSADCLMGFAYWHPALHEQKRLLNPQTGQVEDVRFERLPDATVPVHGHDVQAVRWKLTATTATSKQELTLWVDRGDGRWLGLDAQVKGRQLTYRLP